MAEVIRERLICIFCNEPIRKSKDDYDHIFEYAGHAASAIERAWHVACKPDFAPPDSPFQAAVQRAKQAIADARRLTDSEYDVFVDIVKIALTEQRVNRDLTPTQERD